ncbi:hypothetical protein AB0K60_15855 [Thermopolyspora sp. NPDC052614]|uniref:hypothetical protein n=1 Tax=Thermopolyspora sp. NPDC052614 TaxID=3155682 RepID=UPI0034259C20
MLGTQAAELQDGPPPGVAEALELIDGFDGALAHGFARLGEDHGAALAALAGALAATPLGDRLAEAVAKAAAGSAGEEHLSALAGARTALFGAVHDALLARLDAALGRGRTEWELERGGAEGDDPAAPAATEAGNLLAGCRSWLHELAVAGWRGVDHDLVSASSQMLEALLAEPGLRRAAVLLDGLAAELRASCPVGTMEHLPARRWADLWARALLLTQTPPDGGPAPMAAEPVGTASGRLLILGVDVHEHATAVQLQVHAVLEGDGPPRLVRTAVAAAKVDTIVGPALWKLFADHPVLLGALAGRVSLDVTDLPLLPGGDLIWQDDRARPGEPADPFVTARVRLAEATAPAVPPLERHPVRIAEPVLLEGYRASTGDGGSLTFTLDQGAALPVAVDRLPSCGPLTPQSVAKSTACVGLLRWDAGRWWLQPLAVQSTVKGKTTTAHNGEWALGPTDPKVVKAEARAGDAVAVLRERAGRLLRR